MEWEKKKLMAEWLRVFILTLKIKYFKMKKIADLKRMLLSIELIIDVC